MRRGRWFPRSTSTVFSLTTSLLRQEPACFVQNFTNDLSNVHRNHLSNGAGPDMCNGHACIMINGSQYSQRCLSTLPSIPASATLISRRAMKADKRHQYSWLAAACEAGLFREDSRRSLRISARRRVSTTSVELRRHDESVNWFFPPTTGPKTAHIPTAELDGGPYRLQRRHATEPDSHAGYPISAIRCASLSNGTQYGTDGLLLQPQDSLGWRLTVDRTNSNTNKGTAPHLVGNASSRREHHPRSATTSSPRTPVQLTRRPAPTPLLPVHRRNNSPVVAASV